LEMHKLRIQPSESLIITLLNAHSKYPNTSTADAFSLFEIWTSKNFPTLNLFDALLNVCVEKDDITGTRKVMDMIRDSSLEPRLATYNIMMKYFFRKKDLEAISEVLKRMSEAGFNPDIYTYNAILSSISQSKSQSDIQFDSAISIFNLLSKPDSAIRPNTVTYTILLNIMVRHKNEKFKKKIIFMIYEDFKRNVLRKTLDVDAKTLMGFVFLFIQWGKWDRVKQITSLLNNLDNFAEKSFRGNLLKKMSKIKSDKIEFKFLLALVKKRNLAWEKNSKRYA
jgi:pentatricopeptide repeat protein